MAKQALDTIREAEERALKLVDMAQVDSAKIVSDANQKADVDFEAQAEECKQELARQKQATTAKSEEEKQIFAKETENAARELEQKLMARQTAAVETLIKVISEQ